MQVSEWQAAQQAREAGSQVPGHPAAPRCRRRHSLATRRGAGPAVLTLDLAGTARHCAGLAAGLAASRCPAAATTGAAAGRSAASGAAAAGGRGSWRGGRGALQQFRTLGLGPPHRQQLLQLGGSLPRRWQVAARSLACRRRRRRCCACACSCSCAGRCSASTATWPGCCPAGAGCRCSLGVRRVVPACGSKPAQGWSGGAVALPAYRE